MRTECGNCRFPQISDEKHFLKRRWRLREGPMKRLCRVLGPMEISAVYRVSQKIQADCLSDESKGNREIPVYGFCGGCAAKKNPPAFLM